MKTLAALRQFLTLGVIIGALPSTISNGNAVDAIPVMNDLNFIVAQVNANAAAASSVPAFTNVTSFTPTLSFGGSSTGITYLIQTAAYVKIATMVLFTIDIFLTSKGAQVGAASVGGLPFASSGSFPPGSAPTVTILTQNVTFAAGYIVGLLSGSSISIINPVTAASFNTLTNVAFANNSELIITGMYST